MDFPHSASAIEERKKRMGEFGGLGVAACHGYTSIVTKVCPSKITPGAAAMASIVRE